MSSSSSVQFSYNGANARISIISLNIKCPQLSKPKAKGKEPKLHPVTEWRKKKPWENPGSVGGQFSSFIIDTYG